MVFATYSFRDVYLGAGRGGRTPTRLPSADFESAASASSAIPARHVLPILTRLPPAHTSCPYSIRPNSSDAEGIQPRIGAQDRDVTGKCLGSDHAIERIAMLRGEPAGAQRALHIDRKQCVAG